MSSKTDSISTQQWALLQSIFDRAMELSPDKRPDYLDGACDGNARIRQQVEALITAADADEELVGDLIRTAADQVLEKSSKSRSRIGSFKTVDVIGTGGMGVVYLGQRIDEEYEQQVAIKILHDGLGSDEALLRFKTERQILADLNHPNIARLLDGGQTDDGLPYLVMEYIDGVPLVAYCDQRRLSIDERLDLFKQVCSAVAAAHRSLVVHRDIKPSNILVDENGVPKLLDFGIAKVLSNRFEPDDLAKTQLGDRLLTPDYASPEQVQGQPITTSSDIYSLGVLLYQLLAGTRPFRLVDKTPAQMEAIVINEAAQPPSKSLGTLKERTEAARSICADRRNTSIDRLERTLAGELDYIVLMALKKEPERRYASASQFAADITKFQKGQPIVAVRDTRRYLARKFVQRNKIPVSAAAMLLVALMGFSVMSYQQAKAVALEKRVSESALEFLTEVFEASSPGALQKEVVTAVDILDMGASKVEEQLQDQPAPRAMLQRIIGLAYASNGKQEDAFKHLTAALETRIEVYGIDHPYTADSLQNLGDHHESQGRFLEARPLYEQALAVYRNSVSKRFFRDDKVKGQHAIQNALGDLARTYEMEGDDQAAESLLREALEIAKVLDGDERFVREEPILWNMLASILRQQGRHDAAEDALKTGIDLAIARVGEDSLLAANMIDDLGVTKHTRDQLEEAERLYKQAIAIREGKLPPSSSVMLLAKERLGRLLRDQGRLDEAMVILEDVETILRNYHGSELPFSAGKSLVALARVQMGLSRFDDAERSLDEALDIYMRTSGKRHVRALEVLREQGNLYVAVDRPVESLAKFDESVGILQDLLGVNHWQTAANLSERAEPLLALGRPGAALESLNAAIPVLHDKLGAHHRLSRAAAARYERALANGATATNDAHRSGL